MTEQAQSALGLDSEGVASANAGMAGEQTIIPQYQHDRISQRFPQRSAGYDAAAARRESEEAMSVDRTDEQALQGLLIPDGRWQFWSSQSTGVTQADPYPGEVRASRSTPAHLTASGTWTNGLSISLYAVQGGITGYNGARFVWLDGLAGNYADGTIPKRSQIMRSWLHCIDPRVSASFMLALSDGRVLVAVDAPTTTLNRHRCR